MAGEMRELRVTDGDRVRRPADQGIRRRDGAPAAREHSAARERLASLADGQHILSDSIQALAAEIRALIARIDAIIRGRRNGEPPV